MSEVHRENTVPKNGLMELVLVVTYKDGSEETFSFISYRTDFADRMLYVKISETQDARVPLDLIKHTDEKNLSKLIII